MRTGRRRDPVSEHNLDSSLLPDQRPQEVRLQCPMLLGPGGHRGPRDQTGNPQKKNRPGAGYLGGDKAMVNWRAYVMFTDVRVVNGLDVSLILSWNFHFPAELRNQN